MNSIRTCFSYGFFALIFFGCIQAESKNKRESLVEVRAVFINCETFDRPDNPDNPSQRFERQELFKHNALRGCSKKLALTVKIASPVDVEEEIGEKESSCDEYIPIDHVFEGSDRKRVRLLNPYILRLRREAPKQAYKLHRIDTVCGVFKRSDFAEYPSNSTEKRHVSKSREPRDVESLLGGSPAFTLEHEDPRHRSYSVRIGRLQELIKSAPTPSEQEPNLAQDCGLRLFKQPNGKDRRSQKINKKQVMFYDNYITKDKRDTCLKNSTWGREKRQKEVMITLMNEDEEVVTPKYRKEHDLFENLSQENIEKTARGHSKRLDKPMHKNVRHSPSHAPAQNQHNTNGVTRFKEHPQNSAEYDRVNDRNYPAETDFALYEIGNPNLFYNIKVQLFEKMSTPEGKTVWNDLTKGAEACVSSASPEWKGTDVNVRYRPAEWISRDDFTLPKARLCLLEPLQTENFTVDDDVHEVSPTSSNENYIVVPLEDVIYLSDKTDLKKRDGNASNDAPNNNYVPSQAPHRVEVRVSRAIISNEVDKLDVARMGSDTFLILPHRRPHHSQIDVEVRADDNQLVRVGSSGRLATVVSDNTRKTRTTIHFQATNTGLASARFKAMIRECGPELSALIKEKGAEEISSDPIVLPPHHTRRMKLEVPVGLSNDVAHCNVALLNDEDEAVAVRDVSIRKGDRCFCVWHCDCVCLGEDPKLLCREMSQPQQVAAGLPTRNRARYARSVCYPDSIVLDFFSIFVGVIIFLLLLGVIKAVIGVFCVPAGQVGWGLILETPRTIQKYYEPSLCGRKVVYKEGWPVHPDTKERTVRVLSPSMGFLLNLIFFLALPCLALQSMCRSFYHKANCSVPRSSKTVYSAHDIQTESLELIVRRKQKNRLTRWMTPFAEELAADVFERALDPTATDESARHAPQKEEMQPLLLETKMSQSQCNCHNGCASIVADSEQEDTEYVLMQMQKSRESLARSQKKLNDSIHSTERQTREALATTSKK